MNRLVAAFLPLVMACAGPGNGPGGGGGAATGTAAGSPTTGAPTTAPSRIGPLDLITGQSYGGLRVRIDHVEGRAPDPQALDLVRDALTDLVAGGQLTKPAGIELVLDEVLPAGTDTDAVRTFDELATTLEDHAGPDVEGSFAVIHALWTDGRYEGDSDSGTVLGFAWGGNKLVMLADNIDRACAATLGGPLGAGLDDSLCEAAEGSVLLHELGHLFGLVNNGLPMVADHQDPDHGHHDANDECLMYWAMETSSVTDRIAATVGLQGPRLKEFDAACKADLAAAQP